MDKLQILTQSQWEKVKQATEYRMAENLVDEIHKWWFTQEESFRQKWPSWWDQIHRSSTSVPLNVAEGWGRNAGHKLSFMFVARGSLYETAAAWRIIQNVAGVRDEDVEGAIALAIEALNISIAEEIGRKPWE